MVLLLVQAGLTLATVIHCASFKGQLCIRAPYWDDSPHAEPQHCGVLLHTYTSLVTPKHTHTWMHTMSVSHNLVIDLIITVTVYTVHHKQKVKAHMKNILIETQVQNSEFSISTHCKSPFILFFSLQQGSSDTLREFDKEKAWKAVVVQMAQWAHAQGVKRKDEKRSKWQKWSVLKFKCIKHLKTGIVSIA